MRQKVKICMKTKKLYCLKQTIKSHDSDTVRETDKHATRRHKLKYRESTEKLIGRPK